MNAVRLSLTGLLVLGLVALAGAQEKSKAKGALDAKLVGTWEVSKGKAPKGARMQFTKDGKMIVTFKEGDKEVKHEASYTVDGSTIKMKVKRGDKERTRSIKIVSVGARELVLEGPDGESMTLKRVGSPSTKDKKK
jgi:uncharacterized protein (TIGR03066 family)